MAENATVTHNKVLTIPDDVNPFLARPSDWNYPHIFTGGQTGDVLTRDTNSSYGATFSNIYTTFSSIDLSKNPYNIDLTGNIDATGIINNAILSASDGSRFIIPPGTIKITNTIIIENKVGISITGAFGGTTFVWNGPSNVPMFHIWGCNECQLNAFSVSLNANLDIAVSIDTRSGSQSRGNRFNSLYILGTNHTLNYGFVTTTSGGGGDNANDLMRFTECTVNNYFVAGWAFGHTSSRGNTLVGCNFFGNRFGSMGIVAASLSGGIPVGQGGSFNCYGVGGGGNIISDFYIYATGENNIIGGRLQGSNRLLICDDASALYNTTAPTILASIRWEDDQLASDKYAIFFREPGPLTLLNNVIGIPTNGRTDVQIYLHSSGTGTDGPEGGYTSIGNYYQNTTNPFAGDGINVSMNDIYGTLKGATGFSGKLYIPTRVTANLPAASTSNSGRILIEDAGVGNKNLIIYSGNERYRIDGGSPF